MIDANLICLDHNALNRQKKAWQVSSQISLCSRYGLKGQHVSLTRLVASLLAAESPLPEGSRGILLRSAPSFWLNVNPH